MKNWKTNLTAIVIVFLIAIYFLNKITTEQFLTATTFLTALGLFASKDSDKNSQRIIGGSTPPKDKDEK